MRIRHASRGFPAALAAGLVVSVSWFAGGAPAGSVAPAAAPGSGTLKVTYVARVCDHYTDVMANKARNNLQESLRDLGPDSNYARNETVSVAKEQAGTPSPPCRPLTGWRFSTGRGYQARSAATQNLSTVTGELRRDVVTQASTPELDARGNDTGRTLDGAVTVDLTPGEVAAVNSGLLVAQGGTPQDPLDGKGDEYGFAALRCAQDALNGDNVDFISYPSGTSHVFCYYYAITPPPGAGTITVAKQVTPDSNGPADFRFDGNISYADTNDDGVNDFVLHAAPNSPASQTFVRGEAGPDDPWTFQEKLGAGSGWQLVGAPTCTQVNSSGGPGSSPIFKDSTGLVQVQLVAGDHVTCTYTDRRLSGDALLRKQSVGGTGTFDIGLRTPQGSGVAGIGPTTTVAQGEAVTVAAAPAGATPGTYTATETAPTPDGTGTWELTGAYCNGASVPVVHDPVSPSQPYGGWHASYDVTSVATARCLLTNTFTPGGAITIEKVTEGGTGSFKYLMTPRPPAREPKPSALTYPASATTTAEGVAVTATRPDGTPGPIASGLPVGLTQSYLVKEIVPPGTAAGSWRLTGVDCGGAPVIVDKEAFTADVHLVVGHATPTCRFTNTYVASSTLDVVKDTTGDTSLRPDPARLELSCDDGTKDRLEVPGGATTGAMHQHVFADPVSCTLTEPETGARPGTGVSTLVLRTDRNGQSTPVALGEPFAVGSGEAVTVTVTNTVTPRPPGPSPSASPSSPGQPGSPHPAPGGALGGRLPGTGAAFDPRPLLAWALLAIAVGGGVLGMTWVRRRR